MTDILRGQRKDRPAGAMARHGDFVEIGGVPIGVVGMVFPEECEILGVGSETMIGNVPVRVSGVYLDFRHADAFGVRFYYYERG